MENTRRLRLLVYGDIGGSGGYVRYCKGLFGSDMTPNDIEVVFICSTKFYNELKPLDKNIKVITHPWPASTSQVKRAIWQLLIYPALVRKFQPDIEFYPSGQARVYFRNAKSVSACHNLLLFVPSEIDRFTDLKESNYFTRYRDHQANSFQLSSGVIFFSNHSCKVVTEIVPKIKVTTIIPHGLEEQFRFPNGRNYTFGSQINLLYVSSLFPYKHHLEVIKSLKLVREATRVNVMLRLVGEGSQSAIDILKYEINNNNLQGFVEMIGGIDHVSMQKEYRHADLFIFASSCETFGITLLEAMGARLPIACSNRTGLPAILQDACIYFNPEDPCSIANALRKLISNEELRKKLGEKAYKYSLEYTWERSAQQTFGFIRQIAEQHTSWFFHAYL